MAGQRYIYLAITSFIFHLATKLFNKQQTVLFIVNILINLIKVKYTIFLKVFNNCLFWQCFRTIISKSEHHSLVYSMFK